MQELTNNQLRAELKSEGLFVDILDKYRNESDSLTDKERKLLWLGVSDLCFNLAKKHYGEPQKVGMRGQWYDQTKDNDSHYCRIITVLQFIKESKLATPIKSILFSIHRRYPWIELVVEMSVLGVSYLDDLPITKKVNSSITQNIVLGCQLERQLNYELNRTPTYKEICCRFAENKSKTTGSVNFPSIQRFITQYWLYKQSKNSCTPMQLDETCFDDTSLTDSILSA